MSAGNGKSPKGRFYGVVVKVADMPRCRAFYSEVLGLGPPVINSNFWVEFEPFAGAMVLALQQTGGAAGVAAGNVAWCLSVEDLGATRNRLLEHGVAPQNTTELPSGARIVSYADPEGNPFMVVEQEPSTD